MAYRLSILTIIYPKMVNYTLQHVSKQFFEIDSPIDSFTLAKTDPHSTRSVDVRIKRLNCKIDRAGSMRRRRRKLALIL